MRILATLAATATIALVLGLNGQQAQEKFQAEGVEVLTRGPVHEAFAEPALPRQAPAPLVPKKPPEPIPEMPPELKPDGDPIWIPGYWAWDDDSVDFLWVSGIWRIAPPEHLWVPGCWQQADGGWHWVSGYWSPLTQEETILYPPPPEPVAEAIPPQPNVASLYAPGCWLFVEGGYRWRSGLWVALRPGWLWTPCSYVWTPGGYVFCGGRWDYDFDRRGVLFAPVRFEAALIRRQGWFHRPHYCLAPNTLFTALFVRPSWNHYYFGDFYDPTYVRHDFHPWVDFRVAGRYPDPVFAYYRWNHRERGDWEKSLRATYVARRENPGARPPHTLVEQQKKGNVQVAVNLAQFKPASFKLQAVTQTEVQKVTKTVEQFRAVSQKRVQVEAQVRAKGAIEKPVKIDLPRAKITSKAPDGDKAPPPAPKLPKAEGKLQKAPDKVAHPTPQPLTKFIKEKDKSDNVPKDKPKPPEKADKNPKDVKPTEKPKPTPEPKKDIDKEKPKPTPEPKKEKEKPKPPPEPKKEKDKEKPKPPDKPKPPPEPKAEKEKPKPPPDKPKPPPEPKKDKDKEKPKPPDKTSAARSSSIEAHAVAPAPFRWYWSAAGIESRRPVALHRAEAHY